VRILAAAATSLSLLACSEKPLQPVVDMPPLAPMTTTTVAEAASAPTPWVKARKGEDVALLEAPAVVLATPESNAGVSPPFRARIVRVHVRPGERVARGAPVADVVMPDVVQAAGAYASAATRVDAYGRRKAQLAELKKEGLVRLTEILDVETKLAEARADQQTALALLRAAGLGADNAQRILTETGEVTLRSPITGVVTQVKAAIGENREAAGEPIVRMAGEGEPRVEARLARVLPGDAEYELWLPTGERFPLHLVGRAPQMDARDGTTLVWFAAAKGVRLVQGQTGKVKIRLKDQEKTVAVPARAVGLGESGAFVVVNRGGKTARVPVTVIAASGSEALIKGNLAVGDELAADAALAASAAGIPEATGPASADIGGRPAFGA
jgi:membrane fusion protein, heavy metal efflux system